MWHGRDAASVVALDMPAVQGCGMHVPSRKLLGQSQLGKGFFSWSILQPCHAFWHSPQETLLEVTDARALSTKSARVSTIHSGDPTNCLGQVLLNLTFIFHPDLVWSNLDPPTKTPPKKELEYFTCVLTNRSLVTNLGVHLFCFQVTHPWNALIFIHRLNVGMPEAKVATHSEHPSFSRTGDPGDPFKMMPCCSSKVSAYSPPDCRPNRSTFRLSWGPISQKITHKTSLTKQGSVKGCVFLEVKSWHSLNHEVRVVLLWRL